MAKSLNFNNVKKSNFTVTLPDEKNTVLLVRTPTKKMMGELISLGDEIESMSDNSNVEILDRLYVFCARLLSANVTNTRIEAEYLEEILDYSDVMLLFKEYMKFVSEVFNTKN